MIRAPKHPTPANPAAVSFIDKLPPGQIFDTYRIIELIRGKKQVDMGSSVEDSLNASIGRWLKRFQEFLGIVEHRSKERVYINGRRTCCSEWRKL